MPKKKDPGLLRGQGLTDIFVKIAHAPRGAGDHPTTASGSLRARLVDQYAAL